MKKKLVIVGIVVLLICIGLSGCDELEDSDKPNYIYVSVTAQAYVYMFQNISTAPPGMSIEMQILKAGAVKKTGTFTTQLNGYTGIFYHTVKVYKEQDVRVYANLQSVLPQEYIDEGYSVETFDSCILTWEYIFSIVDWGGTYSWYPTLYFEVKRET